MHSMEVKVVDTQTNRGKRVAGVGLIAIGLLILVAQFIRSDWLGLLFLPALGLVFLVWGSVARSVGLLIPGGILSGIGLGVFLIEKAIPGLEDVGMGGVFFLSFGLGWGLITLLSAIFTDEVHWWPLIPGGILALIGGMLLVGGVALEVLDLIGRWWPLSLVGLGFWLLLRRNVRR
jgi:hypothetical protein